MKVMKSSQIISNKLNAHSICKQDVVLRKNTKNNHTNKHVELDVYATGK